MFDLCFYDANECSLQIGKMTMSSELRKHFGQLEGAPRSKVIHNAAPNVTCDTTQAILRTQQKHKKYSALFCSRRNLKPDTQVT
jgi:hypothetical protein